MLSLYRYPHLNHLPCTIPLPWLWGEPSTWPRNFHLAPGMRAPTYSLLYHYRPNQAGLLWCSLLNWWWHIWDVESTKVYLTVVGRSFYYHYAAREFQTKHIFLPIFIPKSKQPGSLCKQTHPETITETHGKQHRRKHKANQTKHHRLNRKRDNKHDKP